MHSKTMYAMAQIDDLTDDGAGLIRIQAEFNEPETEIDVVTYSPSEDHGQNRTNVHSALVAAGYRVVGSTMVGDAGEMFVPVDRAKTTIESVLSAVQHESGERYIPSRYPYTYAADLLRGHPEIVPTLAWEKIQRRTGLGVSSGILSRAEASEILQVWADIENHSDLPEVVADAYLKLHHIERPSN